MKAQAVASRAPARGGRAAVQAMHAKSVRPAGDAHELQAQQGAARFMRGELGLGAGLTPTAAAHWQLPGSVAQALPMPLRAGLEAAYDADLSGLRVYADAPAQAAATALGAQAFTAGASIYFAAQAWSPSSPAGRELIAHEVAHVLQQSGRASHLGRRRLEPGAAGGAGVQRQPGGQGDQLDAGLAAQLAHNAIGKLFMDLKALQPSTDSQACVETMDRRLQGEDVAALAQAGLIKAAVDGLSLAEATASVDELLAKVPADDLSDAVKAVYFDAYKSLNADASAFALVGNKPPEQTAFGSWSYYQAHRRGDASWVTGLLSRHAVAGSYYPKGIVAVARMDFYGTTRGPLNLDMNLQFNQKMVAALVEAIKTDPLMPDERSAVALRALFVFDTVRLLPFKELAKTTQATHSLWDRFLAKLSLIKRYVDPQYLPGLAKLISSDPEVLQIAVGAGALIAPIAERAGKFWQSVIALGAGIMASDKDTGVVQLNSDRLREALRQRLPGLKPLAGVEKRLLAVLDRAARLTSGALPKPANVQVNQRAAADSIAQLVYQVDGALAARDKKIRVTEVPKADPLTVEQPLAEDAISDDMVYGAVLLLLFKTHHLLLRYSAPVQAKDPGQRLQDQDDALAAFVLAARGFNRLGDILGYKKLQRAAEQVEFAQQRGLKTSHVGLLEPFAQTPASLRDFAQDFPTGTVSRGALTGASLVLSVYALYYEKLLAQLKTALAAAAPAGMAREFDYTWTEGRKHIVDIALDAVGASLQLPRKYQVPRASSLLYIRPEDQTRVADFLPRSQPHFQALMDQELGADEDLYIPQSIRAHAGGFVVWMLPDLGALVTRLAAVPGLALLRRADGQLLGPPEDYARPRDWLDALDAAAANDAGLRKSLADAIQRWMTGAFTDLDAPLRRATNNERRSVGPLIAEHWRSLTTSFLKSPKTYFEAPRQALELMLVFAGNVQPVRQSEQLLQMSGLMLELAPVLVDKLGASTRFGNLISISGTSRLDIVLPLYPYVIGAADFGADSANVDPLRTLALAFDIAELGRRSAQLGKLAQEFKSTAQSFQGTRELQGLPGENMLRVPDRGYPIVGKTNPTDTVDDSFLVDGIVYTLVKVHKAFTYQPELLSKPSVMDREDATLGQARLWVDGQLLAADAPEQLLVTIMRATPDGKQAEIPISSKNTALLSELTYAMHMHVVLEQLDDLAGVLEGFAGVIMSAMQIAFPGAAPAIAFAEISGSILQFFGSAEYATLRAALDTDSGSLFEKGIGSLKDELTLDALWDYLLFDTLPPALATLRGAAQLVGRMNLPQRRGDDKTKSAMRKVFGRLVRVGAELVHGVEVVHDHVEFPVRKLALFVEGSPWVALLLRVVARNIHRLQGLDPAELGIDKAADMVGQVQQMYLRFEDVIDGLSSYELPEELVPLEAIIGLVVNFIIDRLPIKYRLPLKGSRSVPEVEEVFQWLFGKAADQLREARLDPNILWREYARAALNPYLQQAGQAVSDEAHGLLKQVPFLHELASMQVDDVALQFITRDVPAQAAGQTAAQPKLRAGAAAGVPLLPAGPGRGLDASAQAQARRGWGHDFSHVRLHQGPAVDAGLRQGGALGATSGSHVYLDSGAAARGDLLNHELAHVLQQTGPRPLGQRHSSQPVRAQGAGGWHVDGAAEAQADQLAQAAREPAPAPRTVRRSHGLQPKLTDTIAKFFDKLGDPAKLQSHAQSLLDNKVDAKALQQAAPQLKDSFSAKLIEALRTVDKTGSVVSFAGPFDSVGTDLIDYVVGNRRSELDTGLPHVLASGLIEVQRKTNKGKTSAGTEKFWIISPGRVETSLEEFFFAVAGISIDVEFKTVKTTGPDGKARSTIDPVTPFKKLRFNYLHLPMVGGTAKLWLDIMKHSFPKETEARRTQYQGKVRLALQGLQPGPGIFDSAKRSGAKVLVFGRRAQDLIESYIHPAPTRDLPGDAAPKWADYIRPDPQPQASVGAKKYGQIGLRLGRYKDKANAEQQKGTDRESHHTVQYLLLEYFVNSKDRHQPFPNSLALYPNIKGSGRQVDLIAEAPGGDTGIQVSANEKGRGAEMPTILLSAHTHSLGGVHVSPKADDLDAQAPSQGAAIHGIYKDALGAYADLVLGKPAPLQAIAAKRAGKPVAPGAVPKVGADEVTSAMLSSAIFNATCKTYTWMRAHMNERLKTALDTRELEYYEALVASAASTSIYAGGQPQAGYKPAKVGASIGSAVLNKQVEVLQSASFGFKEV